MVRSKCSESPVFCSIAFLCPVIIQETSVLHQQSPFASITELRGISLPTPILGLFYLGCKNSFPAAIQINKSQLRNRLPSPSQMGVCVSQAGHRLLGSGHPPTSASGVVELEEAQLEASPSPIPLNSLS